MRSIPGKSFFVPAVAVLVFAFSTSVAADPVLDLIERARDAYQEKNYKLAHDLLQEATGKIHEKIGSSFEAFLPGAPSGWTEEQIETERLSASDTGTSAYRITRAGRRYIHKSDEHELEVSITNSPQILEGYRQTVRTMKDMSPAMKKMMMEQQGTKVDQKNGWYIVIERNSSGIYKLSALRKGVIVQVEDARSEEMARDFLERINPDGLEKAAEE